MLLNSAEITSLAAQGMIEGFVPQKIKQVDGLGMISYGLSGYGYDLRLSAKDFQVFRHVPGTVIDPKNFNPQNLEQAELKWDEKGEFFILSGHSYALGVVVEKLNIPSNLTCLFIGKSTYARCGIIANLTPGEAGWRGYLTVEISNASPADARIYANEGIVQALFFEGRSGGNPYGSGKYQDQEAQVTVARI